MIICDMSGLYFSDLMSGFLAICIVIVLCEEAQNVISYAIVIYLHKTIQAFTSYIMVYQNWGNFFLFSVWDFQLGWLKKSRV